MKYPSKRIRLAVKISDLIEEDMLKTKNFTEFKYRATKNIVKLIQNNYRRRAK